MSDKASYIRRAWISILAGFLSSLVILFTPFLIGMGYLSSGAIVLPMIVTIVLIGAFLLDLAWDGKALTLWALALTLLGGWLLINLYWGQ